MKSTCWIIFWSIKNHGWFRYLIILHHFLWKLKFLNFSGKNCLAKMHNVQFLFQCHQKNSNKYFFFCRKETLSNGLSIWIVFLRVLLWVNNPGGLVSFPLSEIGVIPNFWKTNAFWKLLLSISETQLLVSIFWKRAKNSKTLSPWKGSSTIVVASIVRCRVCINYPHYAFRNLYLNALGLTVIWILSV